VPLYAYSCPECEIVLEEIRPLGMADWPPVECPVCHGFCEQEITSATLTGKARPFENVGEWQPMGGGSINNSGATPIAHGPGCPCCRTGLR
jgi:putative FmdB family regulatory protein